MRFSTKRTSVCSLFGIFYVFMFLGSITDLWTPFENFLPHTMFDSPLDSWLFLSNCKLKNYYHGKINANVSRQHRFISRNVSNSCRLPKLVGQLKVWLDKPSTEQLQKMYPQLQSGGHGFPPNCRATDRVAIIIPYRGREAQLQILLHNLHHLLMKQQLDYGIFVVEQAGNQILNKAKLINIGFVESQKYYDWDCFIFHDVDMVPEDDRNLYRCPRKNPRHLSVAVDKFDYELPYPTLFGGVVAVTKKHMEDINGYSNSYFGWGAEDDDTFRRLSFVGYTIARYPASIARYKMIKHKRDHGNPENPCRHKLIKRTRRRMMQDGLSNLNYKLVFSKPKQLYTHILVDSLIRESKLQLRKERSSFAVC